MTRPVRVRFAPSPTGELHIGGARTALYNWAFARACKGSFILRIEDTDPLRSTEENKQVILRSMRWLGLDWDEGPEVGGDFGPYLQTERSSTYEQALELLKERNAVYPCFCSKESLDEKRAQAEKEGKAYTGYDRCCRALPQEEALKRIEAGEEHVWRLKVPEDREDICFTDHVYGELRFPLSVMDDMILVRSDNTPTYNFAVVCDDALMEISHVIRGDDHLSNTPRQILIYEALGFEVPEFAHLPMILGSDGKKLSKRRNATAVEQYGDLGYLPDALINFLALLGWSLDGETTIMSRDTICENFSLDRINKKDAVFDETKLEWMNGCYIRELGSKAWLKFAEPWLIKAGAKLEDMQADPHRFEKIYPIIAERMNRFDEIPEKLAYLFWGPTLIMDEKSFNKVLLKDADLNLKVLEEASQILGNANIPWECNVLQDTIRGLCDTLDIKAKQLFQPLRVAICGNMVSPPLFESVELMSREDVLARIKKACVLIREAQEQKS